jgi:protein arginine N-methyltransferase 7
MLGRVRRIVFVAVLYSRNHYLKSIRSTEVSSIRFRCWSRVTSHRMHRMHHRMHASHRSSYSKSLHWAHVLSSQASKQCPTYSTILRSPMSTDITQALQTARFNELVHIYVSSEGEGDEDDSREIILKASLDADNGGIQWNPLQDDSASLMKQHLCTKRWFFPMLNDHVRNQLYDQAIQRASEEVLGRFFGSKPGQHHQIITGLDIGSGTGLLAMLSAKHMEQSLTSLTAKNKNASVSVTSLEMSSTMSQLATLTICSNQRNKQIQVLERHSCEIDPLQPKAHFCTSELLESGLLAEGWLPAMRDAWERHLHPQAIVVPQRARVFAQIVEGDSLSNYWGPHKLVTGFPKSRQMKLWCTSDWGDSDYLLGPTSSRTGVQIAIHAKQLLADRDNPVKLLSDAIHVLDFDVTSKDVIPPPEGQSRTTEFLPKASGRAQAVLFWWELDLYGENLTYSTHHQQEFQDHWHQCLFVFTETKEKCVELIQGEPAMLKATSDDSRITFDVSCSSSSKNNNEKDEQNSSKRFKSSPVETAFSISPDRAWQLNDLERTSTIRNGISFALQQVGMDTSMVLDVSDFSLGASMAALLGAPQVFSLESSSSSLPLTTARLAQLSNNLPLNKSDPNSFQILQCHPEQLTTALLEGKQPNVIVAEPYYEVLEGWHLQESLNFFYILRSLKERGVVSANARSVPASASIMVCAFESQDIGRAYSHCDNNILCGFQHDVINAHAPLYDHDICIPAWQYDITPLTKAMAVATIDYHTCEIIQEGTTPLHVVPLTKSGTCHGMLMWIDYGISLEGGKMGVLSTYGRSHKQVIRMLPCPVEIDPNHVLDNKATFSCNFVWKSTTSGEGEDYDFQFGIEIDQ